jgi:hypothetical protein
VLEVSHILLVLVVGNILLVNLKKGLIVVVPIGGSTTSVVGAIQDASELSAAGLSLSSGV